MRTARGALILLCVGAAACATPGQVRRVETQVDAANRDRARSDSAQRAEFARLQIAQRAYMDSVTSLMRRLDDAVQRVNSSNASNFDLLRQQLYQLANQSSSTRMDLSRLTSQVNAAVSSAPPTTADTSNRGAIPVLQADQLLSGAQGAFTRAANGAARQTLYTLLQNYPQSPQVPDALLLMGKTFDPAETDSAKVYYSRVAKGYPTSTAAPTALYKLGGIELRAGNVAAARAYWQQIIKDYKDSPEFYSAQDRLRENP